jgi:hypothetical protein
MADAVSRWVLRIAGALGLAVFGFFFFLTFHAPEWVESFAKDFIAQKTLERVDASIDAIRPPQGDSRLEKLAADLYQRNATEIDRLKVQLKDRSRDLFLQALDQVRNLDCQCRQRVERWWTDMNAGRLVALVTDNERILGIVHGGYMTVVDELRTEIRIFTATNAACFLLLLLVSFAKPAAARHLWLPGTLLMFAALFCAAMHVFEQNWLLTIIHGSYVGWAYAGYLGVAFLFLCDVALNRARITCEVVNGVLQGLGSAASALTPC